MDRERVRQIFNVGTDSLGDAVVDAVESVLTNIQLTTMRLAISEWPKEAKRRGWLVLLFTAQPEEMFVDPLEDIVSTWVAYGTLTDDQWNAVEEAANKLWPNENQ